MVTDNKLEDYLLENDPEGFRRVTFYVSENDSLTFFFRNDVSFALRGVLKWKYRLLG